MERKEKFVPLEVGTKVVGIVENGLSMSIVDGEIFSYSPLLGCYQIKSDLDGIPWTFRVLPNEVYTLTPDRLCDLVLKLENTASWLKIVANRYRHEMTVLEDKLNKVEG